MENWLVMLRSLAGTMAGMRGFVESGRAITYQSHRRRTNGGSETAITDAIGAGEGPLRDFGRTDRRVIANVGTPPPA